MLNYQRVCGPTMVGRILCFSFCRQTIHYDSPTISHLTQLYIGFIRLDFQVVASASDGGTPSLATIFPMVVKTLVYPALLSSRTMQFAAALRAYSELGSRDVKTLTFACINLTSRIRKHQTEVDFSSTFIAAMQNLTTILAASTD